MPATQPGANSWSALWRSIVRVQSEKVTPALGLRNAFGVTLPLAIAVAAGAISVGLAIGTGALNVAFTDSSEPYRVRGRRMLAASVLVGFAVAAGELFGHNHVLAVAITMGWAFAAGLLVALSTTAADLGTVSLVTLIVYGAVSASPERALMAGLLALGGGLFQTALSLLLWPLRRHAPERRALGDFYLELARVADQPTHATLAPPATSQSTQAHRALAGLPRSGSTESERSLALLSQAERIRLTLMMLARLSIRLNRERDASSESYGLDGYFQSVATLLGLLGSALTAGEPVAAAAVTPQQLESTASAIRQRERETSEPALRAMLRDARHQMDALNGQLRSALELGAHATPEGFAAFERREARQPWRLRLMGPFAILRANLTLQSAACRHAIRLAVCVGAGHALARGVGLDRPYWVPMTIAIVLKPDFSSTFTRGVLRLTGTFAGLALATGLFHVIRGGGAVETAGVFIAMFLVRAFGGANYGIFVVAVTALVVLLFALTGTEPSRVIAARGWNTLLGGTITLLAYALWPTWERSQVPEAFARLLDAYREYFQAIHLGYSSPGASPSPELDRARQRARVARSNLEASIERLEAEPGRSVEVLAGLSGILANSHRLAHALMALEAGLANSRAVAAREMFAPFANAVELTLYHLAAFLRGSPLNAADLPDLREAHTALTESGGASIDRHALVNVETDRITNSLNTLSGEILDWGHTASAQST